MYPSRKVLGLFLICTRHRKVTCLGSLIEQTVGSVSVRFNILVQLLLIQCLLLFLLLCVGCWSLVLVSSSWCRFVLQSSCQERGLVALL